MDKHFMTASSGSHFSSNHFSFPETDSFKRSHRHHSNYGSGGGCGYERPKRVQSDNEYLRDRVKSYERGLGQLYQTILNSGRQTSQHKVGHHHRSASFTYKFDSKYTTTSPTLELNQYNDIGMELDDFSSSIPQVTISDVQNAVEKLLSERENLMSEVDDLKQIADAAKRERVLAIDEKDQLLRETHSLKVMMESMQTSLSRSEEERDIINKKQHDLQEELVTLRKDNEQANKLRSMALEERSKIIEECTELQEELQNFHSERDELYDETLQLQRLLEELVKEKMKLEQEMDWLSQKSLGYEAEARSLKEQNEMLSGKVHDVLEVSLVRETTEQAWGFTIEGGRGTEFYHRDPSIVITGVANHTPAEASLRFGDRILMFGKHNFCHMTRKDAAEKIRSCELTTITMEIGRASASIKPAPKDVRIPGKRDFGFSYETRLFVTSTEEGSSSTNYLQPGDEIIQVQGKSAFNMKPSTLKQMLKSSKDGLMLTIQCQPGILTSTSKSTTHKTCYTGVPGTGKSPMKDSAELGARLSNEFVHSPGTPKSTISETSVGYHSLTHSMPSDISNGVLTVMGPMELVGPDSTTGHHGLNTGQAQVLNIGERDKRIKKVLSDKVCIFDSSVPQIRFDTLGDPLPGVLNKGNYRNRPADFNSSRRHTVASRSRNGAVLRQRACSTSIPILRTIPPPNFGSRMRHSQPVSSPSCNPQKATNLTKGAMPITTHLTEKSGKFSFSADNLDSDKCCIPKIVPSSKSQTPKHDVSQSKDADLGLMGTPRNWRGLLSVSTGNMQTHV